MSGPQSFHVMSKPIGAICNLDCAYCYYLEKERLYPGSRRWQMSDDVLEAFVRSYIEAQPGPEVAFAWQGGEPTLLGLPFFRRVVELQSRWAGGKRISNALQTNGTLLDDEWAGFLADHGFLVGLSLDGPADLHDSYRVDKQGRSTHTQVVAAAELLQRRRVDFNTLTVVHRRNSTRPLDVYRHLKEVGARHMQFIPLVERPAPSDRIELSLAPPPKPRLPASDLVTDWSVRPDDFGEFLVTVFDEWFKRDVGAVHVMTFETALGIWLGLGSSACVFAPTCGNALAVEHNGDVYACDHYVYPEFKLGNLSQTPLADLVASDAQRAFGQAKKADLPEFCRRCDVRFACNGECPKHRFQLTPNGEPGLNYLCAGYKRFFRHIDGPMRRMAALLKAGRPASDVLVPPDRNAPCPCGSGRRAKHCCFRRG